MGWGKIWDHANDSNRHLTVLLTGFGQFLDVTYNPSGQCAMDLNDMEIDVVQPWGTVTAKIIGKGDVPVVLQAPTPIKLFGNGDDVIRSPFASPGAANSKTQSGPQYVAAMIENYHPDIVISMGVAEDERGFRLEKYAHNEIRPGIRDNRSSGYQPPRGTPFINERDAHGDPFIAYLHDGTTKITLETSLPIDHIKTAIERRQVPCRVSEDPGMYVCEDVMWEVLCEIKSPRDGVKVVRGGFIHLPAVPGPYNYTQDTINKCIYAAIEETVMSISPSEYQALGAEARAEQHASLYGN